jgi:hypothetical protein
LANTAKRKENKKNVDEPSFRPTVKPSFHWPDIKYFGLVKKTKSSKPLAIVKFDQVQLMVRENDQVWTNISIKKIYRDSIIIRHGRERKTVYRD